MSGQGKAFSTVFLSLQPVLHNIGTKMVQVRARFPCNVATLRQNTPPMDEGNSVVGNLSGVWQRALRIVGCKDGTKTCLSSATDLSRSYGQQVS